MKIVESAESPKPVATPVLGFDSRPDIAEIIHALEDLNELS